MRTLISPVAILRDAPKRAPQDEDYFPGTLLFFTAPFLPFALPAAAFLGAAPIAVAFATFRAFGRLRIAARCAAANAALAQPVSSSGSSNSRAGNCHYEFTVTVLALV
jgi:hypothetical protein